jgi:hypothetical protein
VTEIVSRKHPMHNQTFSASEDGQVIVEDHDTGARGSFRPDGAWLSGDLRYADANMMRFVASLARLTQRRRKQGHNA